MDDQNSLNLLAKNHRNEHILFCSIHLAGFFFFLNDDTDFIEVDYLNGQEIPTIRRMEAPGTLGFVWDIYLDWGISVMDYRGAIKNPGTAIKSPFN